MKKMQFILPPDDILKKYNETEMYKFEIILNLLNINRLLEETRDILLPRLVSGIINIEKLDITT